MLKMFSTQLTGLFNRIQDKESFSIEDGARLLAQAQIGDGEIYLYATKEMGAIIQEALHSAEPFPSIKILDETTLENISIADRVLIFTRYEDDNDAMELAQSLHQSGIPFIVVTTVLGEQAESLTDFADVTINLGLKKGLLPDDEGNRYGYPASMAALFVYYGLKFTLHEILEDY